MPRKHRYGQKKAKPLKILQSVPNYDTYRRKLEAKWRRKGFRVRFV